MSFGNADIECSFGKTLHHFAHGCPGQHGSSYSDYFIVIFRQPDKSFSENLLPQGVEEEVDLIFSPVSGSKLPGACHA